MRLLAMLIVALTTVIASGQSHSPMTETSTSPNPAVVEAGQEWITTVTVKDQDTTAENQPVFHTEYIAVTQRIVNSGSEISWTLASTGQTFNYMHRKQATTDLGWYTDYYTFKDVISGAAYLDNNGNPWTIGQMVHVVDEIPPPSR